MKLHRGSWRLVACVALLAGAGCKTQTGRDFDSARAHDIELGVTDQAQLEAWLGEPDRYGDLRGVADRTRVLYYQYAASDDDGARGRTLGIELADERSRGYLLDSSMESDATDFDARLLVQLVDGRSTQDDVRELLGEPSGRFALPSNLLVQEFGKELPEGTVIVWAWRASVTTRSLAWLKTRTRSLALYFDAGGVLLGRRYKSDRDDGSAPADGSS